MIRWWMWFNGTGPDTAVDVRWWRAHARVGFIVLLVNVATIYKSMQDGNRWLVIINCALCYVLTRNLTRCVDSIKTLTYQKHD